MKEMSFKKYKEEVMKDPRSSKLDFTTDSRLHYVYRISLKKHYYGSRTDWDNNTIGHGYFTTSTDKKFITNFRSNPEDYKIKIIRKFDNPGDKILYESYLHQFFNVKLHDGFINRANQTPFGFDRTGRKATEETKRKTSKASIKSNQEIAADPIRSAARSQKISEKAIKSHQEIAADPIRSAARSKAHVEANAEIKADPIRAMAKNKAQIIAQSKFRKKFEADPIKVKARSEKHIKNCAEIKADPIRAASRSASLSKVNLRPVRQYDLKGNFIREFPSRKAAATYLGKNQASGISGCITGRLKTYLGFIWKNI